MCDCQAKNNVLPAATCSVRQLNFEIEEDAWFDYLAALAKVNVYFTGVSVTRSGKKTVSDIIKVSMVPTRFSVAVQALKKFKVKHLSAVWASVIPFDEITEYRQGLSRAEGEEDAFNIVTLFYDNRDNLIVTTSNSTPVVL